MSQEQKAHRRSPRDPPDPAATGTGQKGDHLTRSFNLYAIFCRDCLVINPEKRGIAIHFRFSQTMIAYVGPTNGTVMFDVSWCSFKTALPQLRFCVSAFLRASSFLNNWKMESPKSQCFISYPNSTGVRAEWRREVNPKFILILAVMLSSDLRQHFKSRL